MSELILLSTSSTSGAILSTLASRPERSSIPIACRLFDACRQPEVVQGWQIESAKFIVTPGSLLISKLNPRIKRVWRVQNDGATVGECLIGIDAGKSPECPDTRRVATQWGVLFTNQHAYPVMAQYYNGLARLDQIDWAILQRRDFEHDPDDPGKKERYQAEALIYDDACQLTRWLPLCVIIRKTKGFVETEFESASIVLQTVTKDRSISTTG